MRRRILSLFVILCMGMSTLACPSAVFGSTAKTAVSWKTAMTKTESYIGKLLAKKHYYFVPFGQDDAFGKPTSLVADFAQIPQTLEAALDGQQIQPVLLR